MLYQIINFFLKRHLLTNLIMIVAFICGIFAWQYIPKEDMPDITFDSLRIRTNYPGAAAEEVEYYVTRPIEEAVRGLEGVYRITSSTSTGTSSVSVELLKGLSNKDTVINEIKNAVLDVDLPDDVLDDPSVRVFKTSHRAILDVGMIRTDRRILDVQSRKELQSYARALENRLRGMPEVNDVSLSGYLAEEIKISAYPNKFVAKQIPFNTVMRTVKNSSVRQPAGMIEDKHESRVTIYDELDTIEELQALGVQGGFEGNVIRLKEVADISYGFEKTRSITKINGHEGIFINVVKSASTGIIDAVRAVSAAVSDFEKSYCAGTPVKTTLLDDESVDVRNRLSIVTINAMIGFSLILITLILFLDLRSSIWVVLGIPFTFCFTLIAAFGMGYSINNVTLAAVILVMGMVVDDAIVVSENITRQRRLGMSVHEAALKGTAFVFLPVVASILTTCIAFVPLFYFSGRFGYMMKFMPPVIFLMLGASMFESLTILPGHMTLFHKSDKNGKPRHHWFDKVEDLYERFLRVAIRRSGLILFSFLILVIFAVSLALRMKFVMFPDEETSEIMVNAEAGAGMKRYDTARLSQQLEDVLTPYLGKEVVGFRSEIARSRRGGAVEENRLRMRIEILPREKREKSADQLIAEWEPAFKAVKEFKKIFFAKSWFGASGGSPIEVVVQENDDHVRAAVANDISLAMKNYSVLENVEIDEPTLTPEYRITFDRDKIKRLSIDPADVASTLRAALEGSILYNIRRSDDELRVRFTTIEEAKDDINKLLEIPVENNSGYLVPLKEIVKVTLTTTPDYISREDLKRTTVVFADIKKGTKKTPLEIAEYFEGEVFPVLTSRYPSGVISFSGEVKDTRESQADLVASIVAVLFLIYIVLALLFNSLVMPFLIMLAIPFGLVGIIFAFRLHGIELFGFFTSIGALGLAGVVVNDSIIMLVRLREGWLDSEALDMHAKIAAAAKTRLRAVILTTATTVAGMLPTAYGLAGYDPMLAHMMLAMSWGLIFATLITLLLMPCLFTLTKRFSPGRPKAAASLILAILLVLPVSSFSRTVTNEEFITTACNRDTAFQEILTDMLTLKYGKILGVTAEDLILSVKHDFSYVHKSDRKDKEATLSLEKLFPLTATQIELSYTSQPKATTNKTVSEAKLTVSQDIAENAFGRAERLDEKISDLAFDVARFQIIEAYEDYLARTQKLYWDWAQSHETYLTSRAVYEENLKLLDNIRQRQKSNIAHQVDVNKIELQVLAKKEDMIKEESAYRQLLNSVHKAMRYDGKEELKPAPLNILEEESDFNNVWAIFSKESRTARVLSLIEEKTGVQAARYADELLPSIKVYAGYQANGDGYALKDSPGELFAGIEIELPFGGGEHERARYETARINEKKARLSHSNRLVSLKTDVGNLYEAIQRERSLYELADKKLVLAEEVLKDETENYSYGRISLNDLIRAVTDRDSKRFDKTARMAELNRLFIECLRITDRLLQRDDLDKIGQIEKEK
ncbi:MAG: efflux RND transporter permease subunit [Candidatus Omnitrophota bacterium]